MFDQEHLALIMQGVDVWNAWRWERRGLQPHLAGAALGHSILRGIDLNHIEYADDDYADLDGIDFHCADLQDATFQGAHINHANLRNADLRHSDFHWAQLSGSDLSGANLSWAEFNGADLSGANLCYANLNMSTLFAANLSQARLGRTTFGDHDLRTVKGLETSEHLGPSSLSINTLILSQGLIPDAFLRGTGVPDAFLELVHQMVGTNEYAPSPDNELSRSREEMSRFGIRDYGPDPTDADIEQETREEIFFVVSESKRRGRSRVEARNEADTYAINYAMTHEREWCWDKWIAEAVDRTIKETYGQGPEEIAHEEARFYSSMYKDLGDWRIR